MQQKFQPISAIVACDRALSGWRNRSWNNFPASSRLCYSYYLPPSLPTCSSTQMNPGDTLENSDRGHPLPLKTHMKGLKTPRDSGGSISLQVPFLPYPPPFSLAHHCHSALTTFFWPVTRPSDHHVNHCPNGTPRTPSTPRAILSSSGKQRLLRYAASRQAAHFYHFHRLSITSRGSTGPRLEHPGAVGLRKSQATSPVFCDCTLCLRGFLSRSTDAWTLQPAGRPSPRTQRQPASQSSMAKQFFSGSREARRKYVASKKVCNECDSAVQRPEA